MITQATFIRHLDRAFALLLLTAGATISIHAEGAAIPALTWTAPAGWQKAEGQKPMRVATFSIPGGEVAISRLGGDVGGLAAQASTVRKGARP